MLDREGDVENIRRHRAEALLVGIDLAGHCHRQQRAAVEGARKGDDTGTPGNQPRDADGILDCFRAGGEEDRLGRARKGRQSVEALGELDIGLVGHDLERGVGEARHLLRRGGDDLGVAVTGIEHADATREVDETAAVLVPEFGIQGALGKDRRGIGNAAWHRGPPPFE